MPGINRKVTRIVCRDASVGPPRLRSIRPDTDPNPHSSRAVPGDVLVRLDGSEPLRPRRVSQCRGEETRAGRSAPAALPVRPKGHDGQCGAEVVAAGQQPSPCRRLPSKLRSRSVLTFAAVCGRAVCQEPRRHQLWCRLTVAARPSGFGLGRRIATDAAEVRGGGGAGRTQASGGIGGGGALTGIAGQVPGDDADQGAGVNRWGQGAGEDAGDEGHQTVPGVGRPALHGSVEGGAQRRQVARCHDRLAVELLGRHVLRRADHRAGGGQGGDRVQDPGDADIRLQNTACRLTRPRPFAPNSTGSPSGRTRHTAPPGSRGLS